MLEEQRKKLEEILEENGISYDCYNKTTLIKIGGYATIDTSDSSELIIVQLIKKIMYLYNKMPEETRLDDLIDNIKIHCCK